MMEEESVEFGSPGTESTVLLSTTLNILCVIVYEIFWPFCVSHCWALGRFRKVSLQGTDLHGILLTEL